MIGSDELDEVAAAHTSCERLLEACTSRLRSMPTSIEEDAATMESLVAAGSPDAVGAAADAVSASRRMAALIYRHAQKAQLLKTVQELEQLLVGERGGRRHRANRESAEVLQALKRARRTRPWVV